MNETLQISKKIDRDGQAGKKNIAPGASSPMMNITDFSGIPHVSLFIIEYIAGVLWKTA
jgi:hypothetical protein